ncbi:hypothetical protein NMY22_g18089 [Coprinellus aureogranulatus]|nr:hypothetical protein NMY22_g18089 [Coprinellus aureogranulatus]
MFARKTVAGSAVTLARFLVCALLATSIVSARPLKHSEGPSGVIPRRGCSLHVKEQDRLEMEDGLRVVREQGALELERRSEPPKAPNSTYPTTNASSVLVGVLPKVTFDVFFHVLYANETYEGGYVPDNQIQEQIAVLNRDYASTNISWNLVNVTRIHNADWFTNVWPGSPQEDQMKRTYHKGGNSSALNVFTCGFNATDRTLGYATLPSAYLRDPIHDGLMIRYTTLPWGNNTNYNLGRTMVHELGHWLGLYHTFEGGCTGVGDNVEDTAPEASGAEGCPVGRKSCPGSKIEDPIHNFMDYSFDSCMTHFTAGQAVRMHEAIWAFRTPRPPVANSTSTSTATATTATASPSTTTSAAPEALAATAVSIVPSSATLIAQSSEDDPETLPVLDEEEEAEDDAEDVSEEAESDGDEDFSEGTHV